MCLSSLRSLCVFAIFSTVTLFSSPTLISPVFGHMEMQYPAPRESKFSPVKGGKIDYSNTSPENTIDRRHPCAGKERGPVTATLSAGSAVNIQLTGGATHGGGHCQFSLSYDNGINFVVIQDALRTCPIERSYAVRIPSGAPSGQSLFAWSWINAMGNREYYMNCADVTITDGGSGFSGPRMLVVNLPGTPTVPEFAGNKETALDLFNSRPIISVGSGSGTNNSPYSSPTPATIPPGAGGGVGDNRNGCPGTMCKSKWGYCGHGASYCNQAVGSVDGAESSDIEEESESHHRREWSHHRDEELWYRIDELVGELQQLEEFSEELEGELRQAEDELRQRDRYDTRLEREEERRREGRETQQEIE